MATIFPTDAFDPEEEAKKLKEAMKGLGTDEDVIIEVVAKHTNEERQQIADFYKQAYGEDLIEDLKSELRSDFEDAVVALMRPPRLYDAKQLRAAMKGLGTDEPVLIEILCSRPNSEIEEIKEIYEQEYERTLEDDIRGDTSGNFCRLMVSMVNAGRDEDQSIDLAKAEEDAREIYEAGEAQWGTDESTFMMILATRSYPQLLATFNAYEAMNGKDMEDVIDSEFSGNLRDGLLAIVKYTKDPATFFAMQLHGSMAGLGTSENDLTRVIVSRSEIDLEQIKEAFQNKYDQSLHDYVVDDVSGDYKNMLIGIIGD